MWKVAKRSLPRRYPRRTVVNGASEGLRLSPRGRVLFAAEKQHTQVAMLSTTTSQKHDNMKNQQAQLINRQRSPSQHPKTKQQQQQPSSAAVVAAFATDLQRVLLQAESITSHMPWLPTTHSTSVIGDWDRRVEVFRQTRQLWETLLGHVRQGSIQPQGKHRRQTSIFCETLLRLYAQSHHGENETDGDTISNKPVTVWEACQEILQFMNIHQLTVQEEHCQAALQVAVRYGLTSEAAALFRQQIDPDQAGYRPYRSLTVHEPVGLYALARDAHERGAAVVENVMQAVHQLCLLSPSDQDTYVKSAGTALGHVGAGLGLLDYLNSSLEAPRLGPALVAATMQALLLSEEPAAAWNLWQSRQDGEAAEWQWSGGSEQLPAVCTDLALRAAPSVDDVTPQEVLALHQSLVQSGKAVSVESLVGLMRVLEKHGASTEAVHVWLRTVAETTARGRPGLVYGDELDCPDVLMLEEEQKQTSVDADLVRELSNVLVPILRACQASGDYALGLLCLNLWQGCVESRSTLSASQQNPSHSWLSRLQSNIQQSSNGDDLLVAIMTCLSGIDLPEAATELFDAVVDQENTDNWIQSQDLRYFVGTQTSRYSLMRRDRMLRTLLDETQRFTLVLRSQGQEEDLIKPDDARLVASALASTMDSLTSWKQAVVAQYMFRFVMDGGQSPTPSQLADIPEIISRPSYDLPITDSLAAALIHSYASLNDPETALNIFDTIRGDSGNSWPLATTEAIRILFFNNSVDDALHLFQEISNFSSNPNLYVVTAKGLATHERWDDVTKVYRLALASRALSEEVCLIAMKAIEMLKMRDKTRLLRSIADEAAAVTGTAPLAWTERQYHRVKAIISPGSLRRLLWWDDPGTAYLDELELVLGQWENRKRATTGSSPPAAPIASARIILQNAKKLNERSLPPDKTKIPHVPRSPAAWKSLVDEIVNHVDLSVWRSRSGARLGADVILAYRNLGSDHDCLAFTFKCLENEITVDPDAMEEAILAAKAINDEPSAQALRMMMAGADEEFA